MPRIKSAIKRVEVAERNRERNRHWKSFIRTTRTNVEEACKSADAKKANASLQQAFSAIDRAVSKGVMHANAAARHKSKLANLVMGLKKA